MNNKAIYLEALQLEKDGNWDAAHLLIQQHDTPMACLIHAYLHRVEGDRSNAGYWYSNASRPYPSISLVEEWGKIFSEVDKLQG